MFGLKGLKGHFWKPYKQWGGNCFWTHMTTWTTHTLNLVNFEEIHVRNGELIWNYPTISSSLIIFGNLFRTRIGVSFFYLPHYRLVSLACLKFYIIK